MSKPWWRRLLDRRTGVKAEANAVARLTTPQPYMLEGEVTLEELLGFHAWAGLLAEPYVPAAQPVADIMAHMAGAELWVFLATWCGDCKRELPRLLRLLTAVGWPEDRLRLIGVDWDKRDSAGLAERWRVERVPTFIVVRAGHEVGRLVERPLKSLEQDIATLLVA